MEVKGIGKMQTSHTFQVHNSWSIALRQLGINGANVLRRAGLPEDLFSRDGATLSTKEHFRLWRGLEEEVNHPLLPLKISAFLTTERFNPPVFLAVCSPDLNTALIRLAKYKRLVCPMALLVSKDEKSTTLEFQWLETTQNPPASLAAMELVYFVQLARLATREEIVPLRVTAPQSELALPEYTEYFRVRVDREDVHAITFSAGDATRPFLTANEGVWEYFEPMLRKRLSELDAKATFTDRVRAILLEMLPGGKASLNAVSAKLRISPRTLHRRLNQEGGSFQTILNRTREDLARHYLGNSTMSGAEISFLLGYEDPNSFFRAFQQWTGQTPERARAAMRQ